MIQSGVILDDSVMFHPAVIPLVKFCLNQLEQGKLVIAIQVTCQLR